jgi:hypothetical protein
MVKNRWIPWLANACNVEQANFSCPLELSHRLGTPSLRMRSIHAWRMSLPRIGVNSEANEWEFKACSRTDACGANPGIAAELSAGGTITTAANSTVRSPSRLGAELAGCSRGTCYYG